MEVAGHHGGSTEDGPTTQGSIEAMRQGSYGCRCSGGLPQAEGHASSAMAPIYVLDGANISIGYLDVYHGSLYGGGH